MVSHHEEAIMLIRGLDVAATGISAYSDAISVVSNNLANVATNAFKRSEARFQDILYQQLNQGGISGNLPQSGLSVQTGRGVSVSSIPTFFEQGQFTPGIELDLTIDGVGFFRVVDLEGNVFYTRNGSFLPKGAGAGGAINLQVAGRQLLLDPSIVLPGNNGATKVDPTGVVSQGTPVGQITLTRFVNPDGLLQVGDLLFQETQASGASITGTPGSDGFGKIIDNTLEGSNVELTDEIIRLIESSQGFSLSSESFRTGNEELRQLVALVQQS